MLDKQTKRNRRHKRIRAKVSGTTKVPRLCVFRSNQHIYAQLIDDEKAKTLLRASDMEIKSSKGKAKNLKEKQEKKKGLSGRVAVSYEVGKLIAARAKEKKITKVVFDRGGNKYHGRIRALAEGAREGGLKF